MPCAYCSRHDRAKTNTAQPHVYGGMVCKLCFEELTPNELLVFKHKQGKHEACKDVPDFPESELRFEGAVYYEQRRAEWRHFHDDHSLCRKDFYLGCTLEERLELEKLEKESKSVQLISHNVAPLYSPPDSPGGMHVRKTGT